NLCEHIPAQIIWACIQELAQRALGGVVIATPAEPVARHQPSHSTPISRPIPLVTPPPPPATESRVSATPPLGVVGPSIPAPVAVPAESDFDASGRPRVPPGQRFRQSSSGIGRLASTANASARRPQAHASPPTPPPAAEPERDRTGSLPRVKRGQ